MKPVSGHVDADQVADQEDRAAGQGADAQHAQAAGIGAEGHDLVQPGTGWPVIASQLVQTTKRTDDAASTMFAAGLVIQKILTRLDGFGVLDAIRKNPLWASIPVVILTAKDLTLDERMLLSQSSAAILEKGAVPPSEVLENRNVTNAKPCLMKPTK